MLLMRILLSSIIIFFAVFVIQFFVTSNWEALEHGELIIWILLWSMFFSIVIMWFLPALIVFVNRELEHKMLIIVFSMLPIIGSVVSYYLLKKQIVIIRGDIK